jgi:hypothetical protein
MIPALRLPPAALNSEPEVESALHLPGGAAITTPEHHSAAGVDAHGGVGEVEGGVVEAEFDQGAVIGSSDQVVCPMRGSVPAISRWMLLRCRHSTIRLATNDTTT